MNATRFDRMWSHAIRLGAAAAVLGLAAAAPGATDEDRTVRYGVGAGAAASSTGGVRGFVHAGSGDQNAFVFGGSHTVEVRIEDGEVSVRLDGEDVPADRLIQEGRRLIILDEDGETIETLRIGVGGEDDFSGFLFWDGAEPWVGPMVGPMAGEPAEEPTVMLGIFLGEPGPALRRHLQLEADATTMVTALYEGLAAHAAGLDEYDIITEIDGSTPADPASLRAALAESAAGDTIALTVIHTGRRRQVDVTLDAYDREAMAEAELIGQGTEPGSPRWIQLETDVAIPGLGDVFTDDGRRIFERRRVRPGPRPGGDGGELDARLNRLDNRLIELEEMLDRLLERGERDRRR